jgi:hypothetical protein
MSIPDDAPVPTFDRAFFGAAEAFTRVGAGDLGGKASGLELVRERILARLDGAEFPGVTVEVPTLTVLSTELFDDFMARNDLYAVALSGLPDDRLAHAFLRASLPPEHIGDLWALIDKVHTPLAVRSSSRLEDALDHPFAGVYGTKMIPNNQMTTDARFHHLVEAVKFVYASTFFRGARAYLRSIGQPPDAEKMAVIIQEVVGRRYGDRYYPVVSAVARSYNYYPTGHARAEDGVVNLALGLGRQIVDGGLSWSYAPPYPKAPPPYNDTRDLLKNSQTSFWAVNMGRPPRPDPIRETEYLARHPLGAAETDGTIALVASTFDASSDRLRPGIGAAGPRALNFAPLLSGMSVPFNDVVKRILALAEEALGTAVELELAMTLDERRGLPARLACLQVRPMMISRDEVDVAAEDLVGDDVLLASEQVLGNGVRDDLTDIVYLKPDAFDARHTRAIARELERVNQSLAEEDRPYLLIGFGRWGSSDSWLGVPVEWPQIGMARVIVEATLPAMNPDLSQGSHFFHNLIGLHVLYLSVPHGGAHAVDWDWLARQPALAETTFVRHVRTARPLVVRVDGRDGRGVVRHDRGSA